MRSSNVDQRFQMQVKYVSMWAYSIWFEDVYIFINGWSNENKKETLGTTDVNGTEMKLYFVIYICLQLKGRIINSRITLII